MDGAIYIVKYNHLDMVIYRRGKSLKKNPSQEWLPGRKTKIKLNQ